MTMTKFAIKEKVFLALQHIAPEAELDELAPNDNLREAVDIGPSGFLNLMNRLSDDLKIDIPETDYDRASTLTALVRYLSDRLR